MHGLGVDVADLLKGQTRTLVVHGRTERVGEGNANGMVNASASVNERDETETGCGLALGEVGDG